MWNRVVLLATGMAFGWGLANYLTSAPAAAGRHRYRVLLSVGVALAMAVWMGWDRPGAGFQAVAMFLFSAAVSYMARARQISTRKLPVYPVYQREAGNAGLRAVIVVAHALPAAYDGPAYWPAALDYAARHGLRTHGWLLRPLTLARIRAAYARASAAASAPVPIGETNSRVETALRRVLAAGTALAVVPAQAPVALADGLYTMTDQGLTNVCIVSVDLAPGDTLDLTQAIERSQVRAFGVTVNLADANPGLWGVDRFLSVLGALVRGEAPEPPPHSPDAIESLVRTVAGAPGSAVRAARGARPAAHRVLPTAPQKGP